MPINSFGALIAPERFQTEEAPRNNRWALNALAPALSAAAGGLWLVGVGSKSATPALVDVVSLAKRFFQLACHRIQNILDEPMLPARDVLTQVMLHAPGVILDHDL